MIDPVSQFLNGSQKTIYDDAVHLLSERKDTLRYLKTDEASRVESLLADQNIFRGQRMRHLKDAAGELRAATDRILADERAEASDLIPPTPLARRLTAELTWPRSRWLRLSQCR